MSEHGKQTIAWALCLGLLVGAVAALIFPRPSHAAPIAPGQTAPAWSLSRVTVGLQADWQWYTPEGAVANPAPRGELYPRATLGYSFGLATLGVSGGYGAVTGLPVLAAGVRILPLPRTSTSDPVVSIGADYLVYGKSAAVGTIARQGEFAGSLNLAVPLKDALNLPLYVPASVVIGASSRLVTARAGVGVLLGRYPR